MYTKESKRSENWLSLLFFFFFLASHHKHLRFAQQAVDRFMCVKCLVAFVKSLQTMIKAEIRRVQILKLHPE